MWNKGATSFFFMWISTFPSTVFWRDYPFSIPWSWHACQRFFIHLPEGLFLESLFHLSICLSLLQYHTVLIIICLLYVLKSESIWLVFNSCNHHIPSSYPEAVSSAGSWGVKIIKCRSAWCLLLQPSLQFCCLDLDFHKGLQCFSTDATSQTPRYSQRVTGWFQDHHVNFREICIVLCQQLIHRIGQVWFGDFDISFVTTQTKFSLFFILLLLISWVWGK